MRFHFVRVGPIFPARWTSYRKTVDSRACRIPRFATLVDFFLELLNSFAIYNIARFQLIKARPNWSSRLGDLSAYEFMERRSHACYQRSQLDVVHGMPLAVARWKRNAGDVRLRRRRRRDQITAYACSRVRPLFNLTHDRRWRGRNTQGPRRFSDLRGPDLFCVKRHSASAG